MYKNRIREIRMEKVMTLEYLSRISQVSIGYLCHLERGTRTNPSMRIMEKISECLGKSISEIFFNK